MEAVQNPTLSMIRNLRLKVYEDVQQGKMSYETALRQVLRYAEVAESLGDLTLVGQMYDMGGVVCLHFGRLSEAQQHFDRALPYLEGDQPRLGRAYNNMGEVHMLQGEYTRAEACYRQARTLLLGDLAVLPMIESNLGHAYLRLGEIAQAAYHFRQALDITHHEDWEPHNIVRVMTVINIQRGFAEIALLDQQFDRAWQHVREGQRIAEAGGLHHQHAQLLITAAHVAAGDPDAPTSASHFYKKARSVAALDASPLVLARLLLEEGHYQYLMDNGTVARMLAGEAIGIFQAHGVGNVGEQIEKLLQ